MDDIGFIVMTTKENKEERVFKQKLRKELMDLFPDCIIINNDPTRQQGISDILILHNSTWAMLEAKRTDDSSYRPNQLHYVELFNKMSFAAVIYPENKNVILAELVSYFLHRRKRN